MTTQVKTINIVRCADFQSNFNMSTINGRIEQLEYFNKDMMAIKAIRHSAKRTLPYGRWTTEDGTEFIFNRNYQPMFSLKNGKKEFVLPSFYVYKIVKVEYFYGDHNNPVDYLLRKFKQRAILTSSEISERKKSLLISLKILQDYHPEDNTYPNQSWRQFKI